MNSLSANDFVSVPISLNLYRDVLARNSSRPHALIEDAIADFLERTEPASPRAGRNRGAGINWESLFLPDKSRLRTKHHGHFKYAEVKGDRLVHDGTEFPSVSQVTNFMRGGTQNNAWRVLEVLLPNTDKWIAAEELR